jgi:hypothetical protein
LSGLPVKQHFFEDESYPHSKFYPMSGFTAMMDYIPKWVPAEQPAVGTSGSRRDFKKGFNKKRRREKGELKV